MNKIILIVLLLCLIVLFSRNSEYFSTTNRYSPRNETVHFNINYHLVREPISREPIVDMPYYVNNVYLRELTSNVNSLFNTANVNFNLGIIQNNVIRLYNYDRNVNNIINNINPDNYLTSIVNHVDNNDINVYIIPCIGNYKYRIIDNNIYLSMYDISNTRNNIGSELTKGLCRLFNIILTESLLSNSQRTNLYRNAQQLKAQHPDPIPTLNDLRKERYDINKKKLTRYQRLASFMLDNIDEYKIRF